MTEVERCQLTTPKPAGSNELSACKESLLNFKTINKYRSRFKVWVGHQIPNPTRRTQLLPLIHERPCVEAYQQTEATPRNPNTCSFLGSRRVYAKMPAWVQGQISKRTNPRKGWATLPVKWNSTAARLLNECLKSPPFAILGSSLCAGAHTYERLTRSQRHAALEA